MAADMKQKAAIVTGGGSGIGRATALEFSSRGARLVIADVSDDKGRDTVDMITKNGGEAVFIRTDVANPADVEAMVKCAVENFGGLHCAFNNAGIEGDTATTIDYSYESWQRVININLTGVFLCCKYEIAEMLRGGGGAIVNMSSILGQVAFAAAPAYSAAKHGVIGLTQSAALENATLGVRVNAVCPGIIETPMVMDRSFKARENPEVYKQFADLHPMKRLGQPEEIAKPVVWLCSDEASFITGEAMLIDGGYVAT